MTYNAGDRVRILTPSWNPEIHGWEATIADTRLDTPLTPGRYPAYLDYPNPRRHDAQDAYAVFLHPSEIEPLRPPPATSHSNWSPE